MNDMDDRLAATNRSMPGSDIHQDIKSQLITTGAILLRCKPSTDRDDFPNVPKYYRKAVDKYHERGRWAAILMRKAHCKIRDLEDEVSRLKLQHFHPVNEDAEPGTPEYRKNRIKMNANFAAIPIDLKMITVGFEANDCTGDTIRNGWIKVNENFAKIEDVIKGK